MSSSVRGNAVRFDERYLHVELEDGRIVSTPMAWYPTLQGARPPELANYQFICGGTGIEWPDLDYHLSVESMLLAKGRPAAA
jgi:hypothetical protein